jgi:aminoglycoside phosphotransferase (APT) family kinase protein
MLGRYQDSRIQRSGDGGMTVMSTDLAHSTATWVLEHLEPGERVTAVHSMTGGITAEVYRLTVADEHEAVRALVLKSYTAPSAREHAEEWVRREAEALTLLESDSVPTPVLVSADFAATQCAHPSLLMTHLPGQPLCGDGIQTRIRCLAQLLVAIHSIPVNAGLRRYSTGSTAESAVVPPTADTDVWVTAVGAISRPPPRSEVRLLHRDFQPGNILFDTGPTGPTVSGVLDWAGMCSGPADLDVAHCCTNLALLHGPLWGLRFAAEYIEAGGVLAAEWSDRRYWRVRSALACSEELHQWVAPWRAAGRTDLSGPVIEDRLNTYLALTMNVHM